MTEADAQRPVYWLALFLVVAMDSKMGVANVRITSFMYTTMHVL